MIQNFLSKIWMFCPAFQFVDLFARMERKTLTMKLFWNLQVVGISCWEIIFCLNPMSNKALKHQTQSYNKYMGMSHTLQTVHNNRAHPSIIKFYIHWQKTWISGFSCKSKLVPSATFSSRQPTFLGSYEYTYSFSVSSH